MDSIYEPASDLGEPLGPGGQKLGFFQRLWGVIVSPGMTFRDIAERPTFWAILLLQVVAGALLSWITSPKLQEFMKLTLEKTGQSLPPEMLQMTMNMVVVRAVAGALILPVILWLIKAGLLKLYSQFTLGAGTFRQLFSVTVWAGVPTLLGGIVHTAMIMMTDAKNFVYVQTSLALLLPREQINSFLYLFLAQFDFFTIWSLILLAIGAGVVLQQNPKKVGSFLFILWLLFAVAVASLVSYLGTQAI